MVAFTEEVGDQSALDKNRKFQVEASALFAKFQVEASALFAKFQVEASALFTALLLREYIRERALASPLDQPELIP
jgi:hypothetical protein